MLSVQKVAGVAVIMTVYRLQVPTFWMDADLRLQIKL